MSTTYSQMILHHHHNGGGGGAEVVVITEIKQMSQIVYNWWKGNVHTGVQSTNLIVTWLVGLKLFLIKRGNRKDKNFHHDMKKTWFWESLTKQYIKEKDTNISFFSPFLFHKVKVLTVPSWKLLKWGLSYMTKISLNYNTTSSANLFFNNQNAY